MATTQILQPGQSVTVTLRSAGTIAANFAGDTLQAVFALPDGASAATSFQVQAISSGGGGGTGGGGGGGSTQCASLLSELQSVTAQVASLQADYNSLSKEWEARSAYDLSRGVSSDPVLAQLVQQLSTVQSEINAKKAQGISIAQEMQAAGCG